MSKKNKKEVASPIDNIAIQAQLLLPKIHKEGLDSVASRHLESAMYHVMQVFNLTENPMVPWSLPEETKEKANDLCQELVNLFYDSKLISRVDRLTRHDPKFCQMLDKLAP